MYLHRATQKLAASELQVQHESQLEAGRQSLQARVQELEEQILKLKNRLAGVVPEMQTYRLDNFDSISDDPELYCDGAIDEIEVFINAAL